MKRLFLIFLMCYTFSYSNYLISNSEIVLFYDKTTNNIHYIKGDIFQPVNISKIEGKIILDGDEILSLKDYPVEAKIVPETNILQLFYKINGNNIIVTIFPSMVEKNRLFFSVDLGKIPNNKTVDFAFHIVPQRDNDFVEYIRETNSFNYSDNISFKSKNYGGRTFIARDSVIENFLLEEVNEKTKKYQDDNLYYIINDIKEDKPILFSFEFYDEFKDNRYITPNMVANQELDYWLKKQLASKENNRYNKVTKEVLKNLDLVTSRAVIPDSISYNDSRENLTNKIQLFYILSKFKSNFDGSKIFADINLKKSETESAEYYTYVFNYMKDNGEKFDPKYFNWKIRPEVLSMVDSIEDSGEILDGRDNIFNYYTQYNLIDIISNLDDFQEDREYILERKNLLYDFILKNYVTKDGLKTRRGNEKSNHKNIAYIGFLPKDQQKKILLSDYKKYYNKEIGVLKEKSEKKVDIKYNLEFIIKLYENNLKDQGDNLLNNIEKIILNNNCYITPKIDLSGDNYSAIYGEMIYLYLTAIEFRENKNEYSK